MLELEDLMDLEQLKFEVENWQTDKKKVPKQPGAMI